MVIIIKIIMVMFAFIFRMGNYVTGEDGLVTIVRKYTLILTPQ